MVADAAAPALLSAQAVLRGVKMSPKKLNVVAALIRGLSAHEARAQLALLPKRGARVIEKVLQSATANAVHNHGLLEGRLRVGRAVVTKGTYLKRIKYHARGKTGIMHHPKAHLTIVVEEVPELAAARLSNRTARRLSPENPAWLRHRNKREARAQRIARIVTTRRELEEVVQRKAAAAAATMAAAAATMAA